VTDTATTTAPASPPPIEVDPALVIRELCSSDLGRALWERAQWRVAADALQLRVMQLESQRAPSSTASAAES
jgi:hypothetical protein